MPYTNSHKHYLEAMGLVPWVRRDADKKASEDLSEQNKLSVQEDLSVQDERTVQSTYRGASAHVHGEPSASLLLIFTADTGNNDLTLCAADNQLLLDMLKAIDLTELSVARCLVKAPATTDSIDAIVRSASQSISAALTLVTESSDIVSDEESASRLSVGSSVVPAWRMPHPSWIQQEPVLKRRAWNVLKAVRASLPVSVESP